MLEEYVKNNYCARSDIQSYRRFREMHLNARQNHDKANGARNLVQGPCVIVLACNIVKLDVKYDYCARFHHRSYHRYKKHNLMIDST